MAFSVFTIGHSIHPIGDFLALLHGAGIEALCDIRSVPASRFNPQFRQRALKDALENHGIDYLYEGAALGGHPPAPEKEYGAGLAALLETAREKPTAIMCAEKEPLNCHRALLVARSLAAQSIPVQHILADGTLMPQAALEKELMRWMRVEDDLFHTPEQRLAAAYAKRRTAGSYKRS